MKKIKIIGVLGFVLCFLGCQIFKPCNYSYNWKSGEDFNNLIEAFDWICANIKYSLSKDSTNEDYWRTPQETYNERKGDCEDMVLLFMKFAKEQGYDSKLIIIEIVGAVHVICYCCNKYYDIGYKNNKPMIYKDIKKIDKYKSALKEYTYNEAMYLAENFHGDWSFINIKN